MSSDIVDAHVHWMEREREPRFAQRTIHDRQRLISQLERALPNGFDCVYRDDVEAFIYRDGLSQWTSHTYYSHIVGFFRWAADSDDPWLTFDPTAGMKPPPEGPSMPKPISIDDLRQALRQSTEPWITVVMLAAFAGLRASEIADLTREDVTVEYVHVRNGKGGKARWIDTSPELWDYIRDRPPGPLVSNPHTGEPVTGRWLSARQWKYWRSIGLPHVHWHRLRHTFGTELVDAGNDLLVVRDLMGHRSVATTQIYVKAAARRRRSAVASLGHMLERHEPDGTRLVPPATEAA
jgi:integrase/recombinase XerD